MDGFTNASLRQITLLQIIAQMVCFVPAQGRERKKESEKDTGREREREKK